VLRVEIASRRRTAGSFDGKTTLFWDKCWAWEDDKNPLGKGLRSRLQQDIKDCETVEKFLAKVKMANPDDAAKEVTVSPDFWVFSISGC